MPLHQTAGTEGLKLAASQPIEKKGIERLQAKRRYTDLEHSNYEGFGGYTTEIAAMKCLWCGMTTKNELMCDWCKRDPLGQHRATMEAEQRTKILDDIKTKFPSSFSGQPISATEWADIHRVLTHSGLSSQELKPIYESLERGRVLGMVLLDNVVPVIQPTVPVFLKQSEKCHLQTVASVLEERTRSVTVGGYSGFGFRVAKGVRFNIGGFAGHPIATTEIKVVDEGTLLLTSNRLVFIGHSSTFDILLSRIISYDLYADAIRIHYTQRKRGRLFAVPDSEMVAAVLWRSLTPLSS